MDCAALMVETIVGKYSSVYLSRPAARLRLVPASPKVCTRHVHEPLCFGQSSIVSGPRGSQLVLRQGARCRDVTPLPRIQRANSLVGALFPRGGPVPGEIRQHQSLSQSLCLPTLSLAVSLALSFTLSLSLTHSRSLAHTRCRSH